MPHQDYVLIGKDVPMSRVAVQTSMGGFQPVAEKVLRDLGRDFDSLQEYRFVVLGVHATVTDPKNYVGVRAISYRPLDWSEYNSHVIDPDGLAESAIRYIQEVESPKPIVLIEASVEQMAIEALTKKGVTLTRI